MRSSIRLESFPKLVARYCRPFEILEKIGPVAYMLAFPTSIRVHNVFHLSLLNKYVCNIPRPIPHCNYECNMFCRLVSQVFIS
jgi:hypothetical protein